ncbi:hypothetical protein G6M50_03270 [Agrobacterium rhizogenes]|uniref:Uncharacterized protein n=2 Tax=unclassified Rhizobium TaxID=2613769 RepID=A0AAU7SGD2_9HYPH|nr:hypothetical protein [Rhizobium rhizogenes]NTJ76818.1 hypothetical protein [Rhizobium rhizogenes]
MFLVLLFIETDSSHISPNSAQENIKAPFDDFAIQVFCQGGVLFLTRPAYINGGAFGALKKSRKFQ